VCVPLPLSLSLFALRCSNVLVLSKAPSEGRVCPRKKTLCPRNKNGQPHPTTPGARVHVSKPRLTRRRFTGVRPLRPRGHRGGGGVTRPACGVTRCRDGRKIHRRSQLSLCSSYAGEMSPKKSTKMTFQRHPYLSRFSLVISSTQCNEVGI
jgi:hypothetical protein